MPNAHRLTVVALLVVASCGGETDDDPGDAADTTAPATAADTTSTTDTDSAGESSTTVATTTDTPETTIQRAPTTCVDGAIAGPSRSALEAPPPAEAPEVEPSWVAGLREPRIVDGGYLVGDLEREIGSVAPLVLPAGEYETSTLGGSSTLSLDEPWRLLRADPGLLIVRGAEEEFSNDRPALFVGRPVGLAAPEVAASTVDDPADQNALVEVPADLLTWFDQLDAVIVEGCSAVQLVGHDAVVYDVRVDPDAGDTNFCMPLGKCVTSFVWQTGGPAEDPTVLLSDRYSYRVWHVDHEQGPLVAVAMAPPEEFDPWVARSARLLVGLDADLDAGPPLSREVYARSKGVAAAGPLVPLSLPDVRVELAEPVWAALFDRSLIVGPIDQPPPWQAGPYGEVFVIDTTANGPVATVDEALEALAEFSVVEEVAAETMLGQPARRFTITSDESTRVFRLTTATTETDTEVTGFGWWWVEPGSQALWLVEVAGQVYAVAAGPGQDGDLESSIEFTRSVFGDAEVVTTS